MSDAPAQIGGIDVTAPLWRKAPEADLRAIIKHLSDASYHYADDSATEWGAAGAAKEKAAAEINRLGLGSYAILKLLSDRPQLIPPDDLIDAVLREARK